MMLRNKTLYIPEMDEDERTVTRKRKASNQGGKVTSNLKKASKTPKGIFAAIVPENVMLIYLSRSSVEELFKHPETLNCSVLGSYVRVQSDPNDCSQKVSHQLLQVEGVKKAPGCSDEREEYNLLVKVLPSSKEIPISMLSDEYFKKEECEELYHRIIAGSASRPTVRELQRKAQMLQKVVAKQWLEKELSFIRSLTDRDTDMGWCATEKGWRKELFGYLERKVLRQKPEGILTIPYVIAEDPEFTVQKSAEVEKNDIFCSPELTIAGTSTVEQEAMLLPVPNLIAKDREPESSAQKSAEDEQNNIGSPILGIVGTLAAAVIDEDHSANTFVQEANGVANKSKEPDDPDIALWYYKDSKQVTQGPFNGRDLKRWNEKGFFSPDFEVWKRDQTPVLLNNMISQMFPN